jgi:DNA-binding beta-propeller fold protein YncE
MPARIQTMKKHLLLIYIIALTILFACKPEKPITKQFSLSSNTLIVGCEGNYTWGNASASIYFKTQDSIWNDAYYTINREKLGDVLQSMNFLNGKIFMVMNNSNRIIISDAKSFVKEHEIASLQSPRYIIDAMNGTYYVSDLYANAISIINQNSYEKVGSIPCIGWTEEMICVANKVYVCNRKSRFLYVVNTGNHSVEDSLDIGYGASAIIKDLHGKLWLTTTGNSSMGIAASLLCLNITDAHPIIERQFNFVSGASPRCLKVNSEGDQLYYVNTDVFNMSIEAISMPSTPFISASTTNIYGVEIDPSNGDVYVSDAKDYVQSGTVYRYNKAGQLQSQFDAGIIPSCFLFF